MELVIVALVIVLLFGTRRLPELGSGLGKAINNFRKSYKEGSAIDVTPQDDQTLNTKDHSAHKGEAQKEAAAKKE